ncbi:MAG: hypothetical protein CL678_14895 [Bdellovibrionaceae bacterium]|nr:hypothetical protein [Pseudobdellovibrionaceae bacterium]|tara:strand:- start:1669 stop:2676 length:1008 start_codon:yes stop_codon:yes gene_type:complete
MFSVLIEKKYDQFELSSLDLKKIVKILTFWLALEGWTLLFQGLGLALITYFFVGTHPAGEQSKLQLISDLLKASELTLAGLGMVLFLLLNVFLYPLTTIQKKDLVESKTFEAAFIPGFRRGAVLALGITLAFILSGYYRYLGVYFQISELLETVVDLFFRTIFIVLMVYCEEFIFRRKLLTELKKLTSPFFAIVIVSALYCIHKNIQFELGWMHTLTLFLLSFLVSLYHLQGRPFFFGAGYITGLFLVLHPLFGLPLLGCDFSGVILMKYDSGLTDNGAILQNFTQQTDSRTSLFITGGIGGPLSSFAFQTVLTVQTLFVLLSKKKKLLFKSLSR